MRSLRTVAVAIAVVVAPVGSVPAAQIFLTLAPEMEGERFGARVAPLGDVNGDGFADLLVLAPDAVGTGFRSKAYVFFGGPTADAVPDLILKGASGVGLGTTLAGPFDFNCDGFDDIALGARGYDDGEHTDAGAVFVFYGGPGLDAVADLTIPGEWTQRYFGTALAGGPFDAEDTCDDLLVTVDPPFGFGPLPTVYGFFGGAPPATTDGWRRVHDDYVDGWGQHLARIGDFDGDGFDDYLATAPWYYHGICLDPLNFDCPSVGAVLIYWGGARMWYGEDQLAGVTPYARLGTDADGAFNFDGDRYADLIAAAPGAHQAIVFFGQAATPTSFNTRQLRLPGGYDVAGLGDVDGDGFADVAVADSVNLAMVFHGGATPDSLADVVLTPEAGESWDALQVTRAGDFDGDGRADLALHFRQGADPSTRLDRVRIYRDLKKTETAVAVTAFQASLSDGRVLLSWSVAAAVAGDSFRVWRGSAAPRDCLTLDALPLRATNEFVDPVPLACPADYWLQISTSGAGEYWHGPLHVDAAPVPRRLALDPATPNPFNPRTTIAYSLPEPCRAVLAIYDARGHRVATLTDADLPGGRQEAVWNGLDAAGKPAPSGLYVARLTTATGSRSIKLMLTR